MSNFTLIQKQPQQIEADGPPQSPSRQDWLSRSRQWLFMLAPYVLIVALQLKVMWGIWDYKDITPGDTSSYFSNICRLLYSGHVTLSWSPLYAMFGASMLHCFNHAYAWCVACRLTIAVCMSVLVLAFMRRMLPP